MAFIVLDDEDEALLPNSSDCVDGVVCTRQYLLSGIARAMEAAEDVKQSHMRLSWQERVS